MATAATTQIRESKYRQQKGITMPIFQMIPLYTNEGEGWVRDGLEVRWGKVKKLKQNPGCLVKIRRKRENEGGLVESKPIDYFIRNGQTTALNQATQDGCTPDQVYEALREHDQLGRRFKLVEYTETQAEIERDLQRMRSIVTKKDQVLLEGSEAAAEAKSDSKFMNPNTASAYAQEQAQYNMAVGASQAPSQPQTTSDGMVVSEIRPMAD